MNKIFKSFLLDEHKFIPELQLRRPRFTYSACDHPLNIAKELKYQKKQVI